MNSLCRKVLRARVFHLAGKLSAGRGDAITWYRLGIALAELGDRAGALLSLRNALLHDPVHAPSQLALGRLLFECGQVEHALQCFEIASRQVTLTAEA
jgi:tetratricopeptide (TPR) repeat protein